MAYVDTHEAFVLPDGRSTHRGVLLLGGQTPDETTALSDQWFLDLHDPLDLYDCDWVRLPDPTFSSPSSGVPVPQQLPTWGGSLVFTRTEQVKLVGGYQLRDGAIKSSREWWTALTIGEPFQSPRADLRVDATQVLVGDPTCNENVVECRRTRYDGDAVSASCLQSTITLESGSPCTGTFSYEGSGPFDTTGQCPTADRGLAQSDHQPGNYKPACKADPYCDDDDGDDVPDGIGVEERPMSGWGRGFAAVAYDPTQDTLSVHGGTTGCSGTDAQCADWRAMLRVDNEPRPALQPDPYFATASDITPSGWDNGWPCAKASAASSGVHHAQGVTLGLAWDPGTRSWSGTASTYVVGGTRFQVVPPGWEHLTGTTLRQYQDCPPQSEDTGSESTPCKPNLCPDEDLEGGFTGEVTQIIKNCANDSLDQAVVTSTVAEFLGAGYAEVTDFAHIHSAAAAAVSPDQLAIVGGRNASGAQGAYLVDVLGNANTIAGSFLPRFGAGAVGDPLYGRVLYFGGHDTDTEVGVISTDETRSDALVNNGAWGMSDVHVDLEWDSVTSAWSVNQEMNVTYDCDQTVQDPCWADTLTVMYQTVDPGADLWTTGALKMEIDLGNGWRPLRTYRTPSGVDATTQAYVRFALPRVVGDGASVRVKLTGWHRQDRSTTAGLEGTVTYEPGVRPVTFGDPIADAWIFAGLPMYVMGANSEPPIVPVAELTVAAPAGLAIIARGLPQHRGVVHDVLGRSVNTYTDTPPLEVEHTIALMVAGVDYVGAVANEDPMDAETTYFAWRDRGLATDVQLDIAAYVGAAGDDGLLGDIQFVESRLGPLDAPDPSDPNRLRAVTGLPILFARRGADRPRHGANDEGIAIVTRADAQGVRIGSVVDYRASTLHELSHNWFGTLMRRGVLDVLWFEEGMARLLQVIRYGADDTLEERFALWNGVRVVERRNGDPEETSLVKKDDVEITYNLAAYTLAQYHFVTRGASTDDQIVWRKWRGLLRAAPFGAPLEEPELRATIGDLFYHEWIEHGREGTPLLKVEYAQADYGNDGSAFYTMGDANSPDVVIVRQVQTDPDLYDWPAFRTVPYFLACPSTNGGADRAITLCDATGTALDAPHDNSNFDQNADGAAELTRSMPASLTTGNLPQALVDLLAADRLIPEHVLDPDYEEYVSSVPANTAHVICIQGPCVDLDQDGWPEDCDDQDANIHPGVQDQLGLPDEDCDQWGIQ